MSSYCVVKLNKNQTIPFFSLSRQISINFLMVIRNYGNSMLVVLNYLPASGEQNLTASSKFSALDGQERKEKKGELRRLSSLTY